MSVSVSLVPILLMSSIGVIGEIVSSIKDSTISTSDTDTSILNSDMNEIEIELDKMITNKEYKTNIVDRNTLVKTLQEHDCTIHEERLGQIKCSLGELSLIFYKENTEENTPYTVKIRCFDETDTDSLIEDINDEYAKNAQEISYNKIKQRLEEKNMTIENEEVYDDDSIVITVNLD